MSTGRAGGMPRRAVTGAAVAALAVGAGAVSPAVAGLHQGRTQPVRNVIFVNGDGMGAAHREAARLHLKGLDGQLVMNSLPVAGLQTTDPRDPEDTITDSAAAASAWATGEKTYNGSISIDVDGNPLLPLGVEARRAGKATGIVTAAQVTDASPAAFFANSAQRSLQSDIARQYLEVSRPDVVLGGGEDYWYPGPELDADGEPVEGGDPGDPGAFEDAPADDPEEGSRGTEGDLVAEAQDLGYQYVSSAADLEQADGDQLLGLFANEEMFQQRPEGQGDEYDPVVPLADMTGKALETLSRDEDGFFLVVEEEAVDEMAHANNAALVLRAMAELDATVALLKDYVVEHPDTLLVVTGDHECGGLAVEDVDSGDEGGFGGTTYLDDEVSIPAVYDEGESGEDGPFSIQGSDKRFVMDWTTTGHTGVPTPVTAMGAGSAALTGVYPNTHLHEVLRAGLLRGRLAS